IDRKNSGLILIKDLMSKKYILIVLFSVCFLGLSQSKKTNAKFKVIAFYTAKNDQAHISFVHEANKWFPKIAEENHFQYDSTSNWNNLNAKFLAQYKVVLFLDTRPETPDQREAFQKYMESGGAFIGFHFSAFALNDSSYPQNWDWYHNTFLGSGEYGSNTWRPTSAVLRVENQDPLTKGLPKTFSSQPNEWYRWSNDLTKNPDIKILLAIDESSFPLGTGPKAHEIWNSGYYPVVWTNKKYKMLYVNMGHNDIDYEHGTNKTLSYTFQNENQNKVILNALKLFGNSKK
ncbi:MAG TPA: ThuA domain-containing protein, partial [Flavobacterium sp.]|nr:ThuA domain-containing protein [Flavobacterium sp.]